ncbi:hypothetical protein [Natrinema versiforme]|uniref:Uncharacterized protein n=1 Tax=Natrinema versiforme JCM 10478 TaxID=1227496 RepID=L9XNV7_9EURY|nr:hypothetical protein [Natrinema versiforme]ELY63081.1 hypothetical protein C489_19736 [Natrinema versiforme JCM 10478]
MMTPLTRRRFGLGAIGATAVLGSGCLGSLTKSGEHDHEHEDPPWEWGGLYALDSGTYTYTYQNGPDPDMQFAFVSANDDGDHGLYHAGETATDLFERGEADVTVTDGQTVQPSSDTLYRVDFADSGETTIELEVESGGNYSIFTAHVPAEFEAKLRSESDAELTPDTTERHSVHDHSDDGHEGEDGHEH